MEEFSDIPQLNLPENETTDIPIFNVPEITPSKIAPPQLEKKLLPRDKKANKQDDLTQALFDYVVEQAEVPIASTSRIFEESNFLKTNIPTDKEVPSESLIDKPEASKLPKHIEFINQVLSAI